MKAKLVLISADADPKEFKLALPTKIGRGQEAKLKLVHPLVSRVHCEIYEQDDQLMVRDLASLNGTFVNDERVGDEMALPSGCRLTIGSANFHVLYGADYDRPLPKRQPVKTDAQTVRSDATIPMSPAASSDGESSESASSEGADEPWIASESTSHPSEPNENTRTMDFNFLSDDEPPKPAPVASPKTAAAAKPAAPAKPVAPAKPATPTKPAAVKPGAAAKPVAPKPAAPGRPPNPAEFANDDELAASGKPFAAKGQPAKASPAAPLPAAGDEIAAGPADESGKSDDDDLDDFFKSIM